MITLLIFGTPIANSGIQEQVIVGHSPLTKKEYAYHECFLNSKFSIQVRHSSDVITYILSCNPSTVVSYDSNRDGRLYFGITIPRLKRLADGKSPYDLLLEIMNKFMVLNMSSIGNNKYMFKDQISYENDVYKKIIDSYKLEESKRYVEMIGKDTAFVSLDSDEQMREFLRDTQYDILRDYNNVVVGLNGTCGNPLRIDIPRIQTFELYVNGKLISSIPPHGSFNGVILTDKPQYYENYELEIDIDKLPNNFKRDEENDVINGSVGFLPIHFKTNVIFKPEVKSEVKKQISDNLKIANGYGDSKSLKLEGDGQCYIEYDGEQIAQEWKGTFSTEDFKYEFLHEASDNDKIEDQNDFITVTPVFYGVKIRNVPFEIAICTIKLSNNNKQFSVSELKKEEDQSYTLFFDGVRETELNYPFSLSVRGYKPADLMTYQDEDGWRCFDMPLITRIDDTNMISTTQPDPKAVDCRTSKISVNCNKNWPRKNEFVDVEVKYKDGYSLVTRVKNENKSASFTIPEDYNSKDIKISFASPGYQTRTISVREPKDVEMEQLVLVEEKMWQKVKRFVAKPYVIVLIVVFSFIAGFGVGQWYVEYKKVEKEKTSEVNINDDTVKQGEATSDATGGTDGPFETSAGSDDFNNVDEKAKEYQKTCSDYFNKMKEANVSFDEASSMYKDISAISNEYKKNIPDYAKICAIAKCYKDAAEAIKHYYGNATAPYDSLKQTLNRINECDDIKKGGKNGNDCKAFRAAIQSLYFNSKEERYDQIAEKFAAFLASYDSEGKLRFSEKKKFNELPAQRTEYISVRRNNLQDGFIN